MPLRVHQDIVLSSQMLVDPAETVVLLPATTRYEIPGGVTQTSTERRIMFSPEIEGRRIGEARPEWEVFLDLARRVRPELADRLSLRRHPGDPRGDRPSRPVVRRHPDAAQDRRSGAVRRPAPLRRLDVSARRTARRTSRAVPLPDDRHPGRDVRRRHPPRQAVQHHGPGAKDAITGAVREAVLMNAGDAADARSARRRPGRLSERASATIDGRVCIAPVKPRNLQVHWPEGNVLLDHGKRSPESACAGLQRVCPGSSGWRRRGSVSLPVLDPAGVA